MEELKVKPLVNEFDLVSDFAGEILERLGCPERTRVKLDIVIDELFGNIAKYSGAASIVVRAGSEDGVFVMQFIDDGKPYDPLNAPEPDVKAGIEDRPIGGLGIYIVKKSVDEVFYEYKDGHNQLTIKKKL